MENVCYFSPAMGDTLESHLSPVLVITDPRVNARLTAAFGKRFFEMTPAAAEVASWPRIGRADLPFRIHRDGPARLAVLDKTGREVLFFRDPEWALPLLHPRCVGRGVGTEALIAEAPFADRPKQKYAYSLAGFAAEQSAWRKARERAGLPVPPVKTRPEAWNAACFPRAFPDPAAAFAEAVAERSRLLADPRPADLPALALLAHYDQQAVCAKAALKQMAEAVPAEEPQVCFA